MKRAGWVLLGLLGVCQVIALIFAAERPAYAYADPGSGLLLMQIVSSTAAGVLFMVRARIRRLFRLNKSEDESSQSTANDPQS